MLEKIAHGFGVKFTRSGLEFRRKLSFEEWDSLGLLLREIEGAVQWWIGDWLNYGERTYGETFLEAKAITGYEVQTLKNYAWIAAKFESSLRKDDLKFSHYAYAAGLETRKAVKVLDRAAKNGWTVRETLTAVRAEQQATRLTKLPLPVDRYRVILADPPWRYENSTAPPEDEIDGRYPTMSLDDICELPVRDLAADDAILFLWSPSPKLKEALSVIEAWGFSYRTNLVWVKDKIGLGHYVRQKHEHLLIARQGSMPTPKESNRVESVFHGARRRHSEKPDEAYQLIEKMYPEERYIELFARKKRDGWDGWGWEYPKKD